MIRIVDQVLNSYIMNQKYIYSSEILAESSSGAVFKEVKFVSNSIIHVDGTYNTFSLYSYKP